MTVDFKFVASVCLVLWLVGAFSALASAESHHYKITVGKDVTTSDISYELVGQTWQVKNQSGLEYTEDVIDGDGNTSRWTLQDTQNGRYFLVLRDNGKVLISGKDGSTEIKKTWDLEGKPWYQCLEVSLRPFIKSDQRERAFRIINPEDLGIVKLKLQKKEVSRQTMAGQERNVLHLEMRSDNFFLQGLWKADYWFDADSALYLRYEGVNGVPGTPKTTVELID